MTEFTIIEGTDKTANEPMHTRESKEWLFVVVHDGEAQLLDYAGRYLEFAEPEPPFLELEWPTPAAIKIQTPFQVGVPLTLLEDAGEKPFLQSEWPNPEPIFIQEPFQYAAPLVLFEGFVPFPFAKYDWPNPEPKVRQTPFQLGISHVDISVTVVLRTGRHIRATFD